MMKTRANPNSLLVGVPARISDDLRRSASTSCAHCPKGHQRWPAAPDWRTCEVRKLPRNLARTLLRIEQRNGLRHRHPAVVVVIAGDVVFAEIGALLHLDQGERAAR